jgi:hypothetical protein
VSRFHCVAPPHPVTNHRAGTRCPGERRAALTWLREARRRREAPRPVLRHLGTTGVRNNHEHVVRSQTAHRRRQPKRGLRRRWLLGEAQSWYLDASSVPLARRRCGVPLARRRCGVPLTRDRRRVPFARVGRIAGGCGCPDADPSENRSRKYCDQRCPVPVALHEGPFQSRLVRSRYRLVYPPIDSVLIHYRVIDAVPFRCQESALSRDRHRQPCVLAQLCVRATATLRPRRTPTALH